MTRKRLLMIGIIAVTLISIQYVLNLGEETSSLTDDSTGNIKQLVESYSMGTLKNEEASITSHQLIVTEDNGVERFYDLPEDKFFISIAPFINVTHPCSIHSLTGCESEMADETFDILIKDENGEIILDDKVTAHANGFIDLWLPRDQTLDVSISHEEKSTQAELSTFKGNNTCITTMQLT